MTDRSHLIQFINYSVALGVKFNHKNGFALNSAQLNDEEDICFTTFNVLRNFWEVHAI